MQLDLSRQSKFPSLALPGRTNHWLRIVVYSVLAVLLLWLLLWSRAQSRKIVREAAVQQAAYTAGVEADLMAALAKRSLSATLLTTKGMALVPKNPSAASLILQVASTKDPLYRDAALGVGFAELAVAEPLWTIDAARAQDHTTMARRYLEIAEALDPIHASTFELLALAYGNLGQSQQAAEASQKAAAFAIGS